MLFNAHPLFHLFLHEEEVWEDIIKRLVKKILIATLQGGIILSPPANELVILPAAYE